MLRLFIAPPSEGWARHEYDGTSERQLLAVLIVSVGVVALVLCIALLMLFPLEPADQSRFPIPACIMAAVAHIWGSKGHFGG